MYTNAAANPADLFFLRSAEEACLERAAQGNLGYASLDQEQALAQTLNIDKTSVSHVRCPKE